METLKTVIEILGFIIIWIAGLYLWGTICSGVFGYRSYSPKRKKRK